MKSTHWRATIKLPDGRELNAWVKQVSQSNIIIRNEYLLREGTECGLTMYVPQPGGTEPGIVRAHCRAGKSVPASMEFRTWLDLLKFEEGALWMLG